MTFALRDLFVRPRLVRVERAHARLVLGAGRTPVRVVAEGLGWLVAGDVRCFVRGRFDGTLLVPAHETQVRFRGLLGSARAELSAAIVVSPAPAHVVVVRSRAAASSNVAAVVVPERPAPVVVPLGVAARQVAPRLRGIARVAVPSPTMRTDRVRPRVRLPQGEPA